MIDPYNVIVILDGSGSMMGVNNDVVGGINKLIEEQKDQDNGDTLFTLAVFDNRVKQIYVGEPIANVDPVDRSNTLLGGGTALLDAIGDTLTELDSSGNLSGDKLVVIYTDGEENSSRTWTTDKVKAKIKELEDTGTWTFTFMSADVDNFDEASKIGISAGNYVTTNSAATAGSFSRISKGTYAHRTLSNSARLSGESYASADFYESLAPEDEPAEDSETQSST